MHRRWGHAAGRQIARRSVADTCSLRRWEIHTDRVADHIPEGGVVLVVRIVVYMDGVGGMKEGQELPGNLSPIDTSHPELKSHLHMLVPSMP